VQPDVEPAPHSLVLGNHERAVFHTPTVAHDTVFRAGHLLRVATERRVQTQEPVSMFDLGHGVTAVEGLDPVERVRSRRPPRDPARPFGHTLRGHLVGHR
jgi:hypothetical protein